ncbi:unnamed protein product [Allacma fusca]|uniref:Uncharacterized protein n=1 Tax=Allacma fusca TaxID=39272 RepID=A0A8J2MD54_9HEXA|nr:unnamed protein product [Allacma fusca]
MSELSFKYVIVGESGVGKTALLEQFVENRFNMNLRNTIGVEFTRQVITLDGKEIVLHIWDTCGGEKFFSLTRTYYRGSVGAILVYDITRRHTFNQLNVWLEDLRRHCGSHIVIMLIGNKNDMEDQREVRKEEGEVYAEEHGLIFKETSARTGVEVQDAFILAAKTIFWKVKLGDLNISRISDSFKIGMDQHVKPSKSLSLANKCC